MLKFIVFLILGMNIQSESYLKYKTELNFKEDSLCHFSQIRLLVYCDSIKYPENFIIWRDFDLTKDTIFKLSNDTDCKNIYLYVETKFLRPNINTGNNPSSLRQIKNYKFPYSENDTIHIENFIEKDSLIFSK